MALADQVDALGTQARGTLAALNGSDPTTGDAAIAEPANRLILEIGSRTAAFRDELAAVPYIGTDEAALHSLGRRRRAARRPASPRSMRPTGCSRMGAADDRVQWRRPG